jgi:hypothetical protein
MYRCPPQPPQAPPRDMRRTHDWATPMMATAAATVAAAAAAAPLVRVWAAVAQAMSPFPSSNFKFKSHCRTLTTTRRPWPLDNQRRRSWSSRDRPPHIVLSMWRNQSPSLLLRRPSLPALPVSVPMRVPLRRCRPRPGWLPRLRLRLRLRRRPSCGCQNPRPTQQGLTSVVLYLRRVTPAATCQRLPGNPRLQPQPRLPPLRLGSSNRHQNPALQPTWDWIWTRAIMKTTMAWACPPTRRHRRPRRPQCRRRGAAVFEKHPPLDLYARHEV